MRAFWRSIFVLSAAIVLLVPAVAGAQDPPPPRDPPPYADFFNSQVVQRFDLRLNSSDWEKLKQNFQSNTFYPADVLWNGQTVRNVGIRSRGFGSRSARKPGLRVDCNRYTTDQRCFGFRAFILDNLTQDPSGIHETVTMKVFERMNVPAPLEAFVRLYINNQYAGLYALVEEVNKDLLARVFGKIGEDTQNDGHLYEFNWTDEWRLTYLGSGLEPYKQKFSAKTHESETDEQLYRRIETLVRMINDLPASRFMEEIDPRLDLRAFVRFLAVQMYMGENDGFTGYAAMNNFYFYRKENSEQHVFIAWDEDNAFWGPEFPLTLRFEENVLARKVMEVPELRDLYYATLEEVARMCDTPNEGSEVPWLEEEVRRQLDLVYDPLRDDTNKPYSLDDHEAHRGQVINFARNRSRFVFENVPR